MSQKVILTILDGVGYTKKTNHNAVFLSHAKNFERLKSNNLTAFLKTSGEDVGLPDKQMGNSEVGHMNIGAGRVVFQELGKIHLEIKNGEFAKKQHFKSSIDALKKSGGSMHIMGLASDGGVHSHINHLLEAAKLFASNNIPVKIHAFADGRDTAPGSIKTFLTEILNLTKAHSNVSLATITGRYYSMDRDNRWERIELAYKAIVNGVADVITSNPMLKVDESIQSGVTDEFLKPIVVENYSGIKDGDGIFCINFRADRVREILATLVVDTFKEFSTKKLNLVSKLGMSPYSSTLDPLMDTIFPTEDITNTLGEVLARSGKKQFRTAETEKYPHVTFFFNGGRETPFNNEDRIIVPSPKVATYDLKPEMSAHEVCNTVVNAINSDNYDLIVVNFANGDMVGHTGSEEAAIKAVLALDTCLEKIEAAIKSQNEKYAWIITADHGNCEEMWDDVHNLPHTQHTTNPVWISLINANAKYKNLADGRLADIAPTILKIMGVDQPKEMTGVPLID